jgi:CPA1 family monovalent cation:H+ antiporter
MTGLENQVTEIIGLLAAALIVSVIANRIGVPYVVALLVVATPIDLTVPEFAPILLFVFLPALIFEAAWNVHLDALRRRWLAVAVLAIPGVLLTAGTVGVGLSIAGKLPFLPALLLGAILAATDPIAVLAVFKRLKVPTDLATIVEGESLFNDGAAIVLYEVVVATQSGTHATPTVAGIASTALGAPLGGAAIGLIAAALITLLLRGSKPGSEQLQVVGTVVAAFGGYLMADAFHLSGIFAAVVAGIALRAFPRFPTAEAMIDVDSFWGVMAFLANALVFVLMGLRIEFANIVHEPLLILLTLALVTAARLILAYGALPLAGEDVPTAWRSVVALSGMRGALSVALVIGLPADIPFRSELVDTVFGVVLINLVVQGLAIGPVISRLLPADHSGGAYQ